MTSNREQMTVLMVERKVRVPMLLSCCLGLQLALPVPSLVRRCNVEQAVLVRAFQGLDSQKDAITQLKFKREQLERVSLASCVCFVCLLCLTSHFDLYRADTSSAQHDIGQVQVVHDLVPVCAAFGLLCCCSLRFACIRIELGKAIPSLLPEQTLQLEDALSDHKADNPFQSQMIEPQ
jgi:hypothetical protein